MEAGILNIKFKVSTDIHRIEYQMTADGVKWLKFDEIACMQDVIINVSTAET